MPIAALPFSADTGLVMGDILYVLCLAIVVWLASEYTGGDGGGKRGRVPVPL
jgi:hypothetical protein